MVALLAAPGWLSSASSQTEDVRLHTNLDLMRVLAERVGDRIGEAISLDHLTPVSLVCRPIETAWYVENPLRVGLSRHNMQFVSSTEAVYAAELGIKDLRVEYADIRGGFLEERVLNRKVIVVVTAKMASPQTGEVLLSSDYREESLDTIEVSDVRSMENPHLTVTQAPLPPEGFFSGYVEPLIVIAAVGTAIFLLFTVRS